MVTAPAEVTPLVGRWPKRELLHERAEVRSGSVEGLSFLLSWTDAGGDLTFFLEGHPVWTTAPQSISMQLWEKFVRSMTRAWARIRAEESYPSTIVPETPSHALSTPLNEIPNPKVAEAEFDRFRMGHDLSRWFGTEIVAPSLWFIREGRMMFIEANSGNTPRTLRWAYGDAIRTLTDLGNAISFRLPRSSSAHDEWNDRDNVPENELIAIALGMSSDRARRLILSGVIDAPANRNELFRGLDEIRAAARMLSSQLDDRDLAKITSLIRSVPTRPTPKLDEFGEEAVRVLEHVRDELPRYQGVQLALWLRDKLGLAEIGSRIQPGLLLDDWGVHVAPVETIEEIHAVSFWGPQHGPAVLWNQKGRSHDVRFGTQSGGVRASLAHEICHLLVDRERALPVAEVLGGSVPDALEERARSFAAELLVPNEWAGIVFAHSANVSDAVIEISTNYGVTNTIAAWQILHRYGDEPTMLAESDRRYLFGLAAPNRRER